jgi:hypothetical protein
MEAVFDKEGNITNLEELTVDEVNTAYSEKNRSIFGRLTEEETKRKQAEADLAKAKSDLESEKVKHNQEPEKLKGIEDKVSQLELAERKRQFGYDNGLSPVETDRVFQINPNPTKETLEDPFVKGGLSAIKAKERLSQNMPGASTGSPRFAADKDLEKMTPTEKDEELAKFVAAKKAK